MKFGQVDRIEQNPRRFFDRTEKAVGRLEAEIALVNDEVCQGTQSPHRRVVPLRLSAGPARIAHAVLVPNHGDIFAPALGDEIFRKMRRHTADEVKNVELLLVTTESALQGKKFDRTTAHQTSVIENSAEAQHRLRAVGSPDVAALLLPPTAVGQVENGAESGLQPPRNNIGKIAHRSIL